MNCTYTSGARRRTPASRAFTNSSLNHFFNTAFGDLVNTDFRGSYGFPATNVKKLDDQLVLELAIPGFIKSEVNIQVEKNVLTVSGNKDEKDETANYRLREFNANTFKKSFRLPESIDLDQIQAAYHQGVLQITLSKKEEEKSASIEVNIQ